MSIIASTTQAQTGTKSARMYRNGTDLRDGIFWDFGLQSGDFALDYGYRKVSDLFVFGTVYDLDPNWGSSVLFHTGGELKYRNSSSVDTVIVDPFNANQWYDFSEIHHPATKTWDLEIDSGLTYSGSALTYHQQENPKYFKVADPSSGSGTYESYVDNLRTRKWVANPATYAFGSEESGGAPRCRVLYGPFYGPLGGPIG